MSGSDLGVSRVMSFTAKRENKRGFLYLYSFHERIPFLSKILPMNLYDLYVVYVVFLVFSRDWELLRV
jgi:hypothetical protein